MASTGFAFLAPRRLHRGDDAPSTTLKVSDPGQTTNPGVFLTLILS
jgi:hypothetical protein